MNEKNIQSKNWRKKSIDTFQISIGRMLQLEHAKFLLLVKYCVWLTSEYYTSPWMVDGDLYNERVRLIATVLLTNFNTITKNKTISHHVFDCHSGHTPS